MSHSLAALQADFRRHVLGGDAPMLHALASGPPPIAPDARLRVYRNHVFVSLTAALAATYAGVAALVGEAFFKGAARTFIAATPPGAPCLVEYGEAFPAFLENFEPAQGLPYLADVARLEWAMNVVLHAADETAVGADGLVALEPATTLRLHPAVRLVQSRWPVDRIWTAATAPAGQGKTVDADAGPARLLVLRDGDNVGMVALQAGAAAFHEVLAGGATLESAAEAAFAADASFDLTASLQRALALRLLVRARS